MQLDRIQVSAGALEALAELLRDHFDVHEQIEGVYQVRGGGVNDAAHRVVRTASGRQFGIKAKPRGGGTEGERREAGFSRACHELGVTEACKTVSVERIPGYDGFENDPCAVTEWLLNSKQPSEISAEEKAQLVGALDEVLIQVARWITINLHFGLADRGGLKNWVWSQEVRRLVAIDTESAWQTGTTQDHFSIVDTFYERRSLKVERGQSREALAFEQGLREMHSRIRGNPEVIRHAVAEIASARNYVSPYIGMTDDEFADRVFSEIA
jgi:hypothetical protein